MYGNSSISGLISGMDTQSLVEQLISLERRPAFQLESRIAQQQLRLSSYDALESLVRNLRSEVDQLRRPGDFDGMLAEFSQSGILSASVNDAAPAGLYSLSVQQIAQGQQIASQGFSSSDAILGNGTVIIQLAGEEALSLELQEGENTLQDFVDRVNESDSGLRASLINTGEGDTPWQMILSSADTGADQLLGVTASLSGGEGLEFGVVGEVINGVINGSSTVSSSGIFAGNGDANFSFNVSQGGIVGTDEILVDWTDTLGNEGQIVIPADYAGEGIEVTGGMMLSFGSGDLQTDDYWYVMAETCCIQSAQDAVIEFGSPEGGADPLIVQSSSNRFSELIDGVVLDVLASSPGETLTLSVRHDQEEVVERVKGFVENYNHLIQYFNSQFSYDADQEVAGVMLGDRMAMFMDQRIRSSLGRAVEGIAGELDHLSEIGIGTAVNGNFNSDGTLALDESMLRDALSEDLDGVVSLLASTGEASDANITFLSAGAGTVGSAASAGYEVRITEAASRGTFTGLTFMEPTPGTPLILDSENSSFKISVDGVESKLISLPEGEYSSAAEVAEAIESAINSDSQLGSRDVEVRWVDDGGGLGHLELESQSWGSSSSLQFEEVSSGLTALLGLEEGTAQDGQDVAGYFLVNGVLEEAQGQGRMLKGVEESGKTLDLGVLVELTALELSEQGEDQGRVQVFTGVTDSLSRLLDSYLDPAYGLLERRQEDFRQGIETFEEQVERIDSRLKIRRERYLREFQRMETLLSELNSQSAMMMSMLGGISGAGGQG